MTEQEKPYQAASEGLKDLRDELVYLMKTPEDWRPNDNNYEWVHKKSGLKVQREHIGSSFNSENIYVHLGSKSIFLDTYTDSGLKYAYRTFNKTMTALEYGESYLGYENDMATKILKDLRRSYD